MEIFDVFSMNGIENYPAAGEIFLENVILTLLKVSQTHFPRIYIPRGGQCQGGHTFFKGGGGAVKYPGSSCLRYPLWRCETRAIGRLEFSE